MSCCCGRVGEQKAAVRVWETQRAKHTASARCQAQAHLEKEIAKGRVGARDEKWSVAEGKEMKKGAYDVYI